MARDPLARKTRGRAQNYTDAQLAREHERLIGQVRNKRLEKASITMLRSMLAEIDAEIARRAALKSSEKGEKV